MVYIWWLEDKLEERLEENGLDFKPEKRLTKEKERKIAKLPGHILIFEQLFGRLKILFQFVERFDRLRLFAAVGRQLALFGSASEVGLRFVGIGERDRSFDSYLSIKCVPIEQQVAVRILFLRFSREN